MDRVKLLKPLIYLIFFILVMNFLANKFYWYSSIWYLDIIMHFLGGLWLGLAFIYLFSPQDHSFNSVFKILLFVLLIGVGWEVFEIAVNDVITKNPFNYLDTLSDIFFDLSGGLCAILYVWSRTKSRTQENK